MHLKRCASYECPQGSPLWPGRTPEKMARQLRSGGVVAAKSRVRPILSEPVFGRPVVPRIDKGQMTNAARTLTDHTGAERALREAEADRPAFAADLQFPWGSRFQIHTQVVQATGA